MNPTPNRLPVIDEAKLNPDQAAVYRQLISGPRGRLPTPYRVWLQSAPLARAMEQLGTYLLHSATLKKDEIEIAVLVAAVHFKAPYVTPAHVEEAIEAGVAKDAVDAIVKGERPQFANDRQTAAWMATDALVNEGVVSDAVFKAASEAFGPAGVADLLALIGYYTAVINVMNFHAVQWTGAGKAGIPADKKGRPV